MIELQNRMRETISEEVMLARLAQSEQMREFFIEMWKQNPSLAKQGGENVRRLLSPLESLLPNVNEHVEASLLARHTDRQQAGSCRHDEPVSIKQRGISLVELIIFIVIIGVALVGILGVMNQVTAHSADPLIRKQALAAAESLIEEIELQDFISASGVTSCPTGPNPVTTANRANQYHIVCDYNGFNTTGIFPVSGAAIAGLGSYKANVVVAGAAYGTIPATSAVRITVTVTDPQNNTIAIDGYRTAY